MNKKDIKDSFEQETSKRETGKVSANIDDSTRAENLETSKVSDDLADSIKNLTERTYFKIRTIVENEIFEALNSFAESSERNKKFYEFAKNVTKDFIYRVSDGKDAAPTTIDVDGITLDFGLAYKGSTQIDIPNYFLSLKSCTNIYNSIESKKAKQAKKLDKIRQKYDNEIPDFMKINTTFEQYYNYIIQTKQKI